MLEPISLPMSLRAPRRADVGSVHRPRLLFLLNILPPYRVPVLEHLNRHHYDVEVAVSAVTESDRDWATIEAPFAITVQKGLHLRRSRFFNDAEQAQTDLHLPVDTVSLLFKRKPHVIISGEFGARSLAAGAYRRIRPRTRLIIWATLSEWTERSRRRRTFLRRFIVRSADAVIVNGRSGERYVQSIVPAASTVVVRQVAATEHLAEEQVPARAAAASEFRMLVVCRLLPWKGVARWLRSAIQELGHDDAYSITIVGDGPDRAAIADLQFPPNLKLDMVGAMPGSEVTRYYEGADVFVFPTLGDEWGLVVNEALSRGLPVIGSVYSQAVTELITPGYNGRIFDPLQPGSFMLALAMFKDDLVQHGATVLSRNCVRSVADLTPDACAEKIHRAVAAVADRRQTP